MSHHAVLIVAGDPLASALLGAAVEQAGSLPHFPRKDESIRTALRRVRPRLVLISCDHAEACSDAFIGPALMIGAELLLVRTRNVSADVQAMIDRLALRVVDPSHDSEALLSHLRALEES